MSDYEKFNFDEEMAKIYDTLKDIEKYYHDDYDVNHGIIWHLCAKLEYQASILKSNT